MLIFAVVASLAIGAVGGWYATKAGYDIKLRAIAGEMRRWEGHAISDVRTLVARVKSLL